MTRLPRRFVEYLTGTQAAFDPKEPDYELLHRVLDMPTSRDGSTSVALTDTERAGLLDYAGGFETSSSQNVQPGDGDSLADLNAARAAIRQLTKEV